MWGSEPEAPALNGRSGDLEVEIRGYAPDLDRLTLACRLRYDIAANGTNVIDIFLECWHCRIAHPAFTTSIRSCLMR